MGPDLIDRAKRGDKEAFTGLVLEHGDRLYAVAYRILRDAVRAEDAVQQTFLLAWRELPSLRDDGRLEAWLYRLLVNACYAEIRHTRRWQPGLRLVSVEDPAEDDAQVSVAHRDELERAFRRLSTEHRAVLVLHHYVGLSGAEVGEALGLSAGTVRSRLHYARQAMRAAIEADARAYRQRRHRMTGQLDVDRVLEDWLAEGPDRLPDRVVQATVAQLDDIKQRKSPWLPGSNRMYQFILPTAGVAAAIVIAAVALTSFFRGPSVGAPPGTPFTSDRHGYTIILPEGWTVEERPAPGRSGRSSTRPRIRAWTTSSGAIPTRDHRSTCTSPVSRSRPA